MAEITVHQSEKRMTVPANMTLPGEQWSLINDDEIQPWYWISSLGRTASSKGHWKILSPWQQSCGYLQVGLRRIDKSDRRGYKTFLIHRLVANAFVPSNPDQPQINHLDGDKTNNVATNLEHCSAKQNIQHSIVTGLNSRTPRVLLHVPTQTYHSLQQALFLLWLPQTDHQAQILYHRVSRGFDPDWEVVAPPAKFYQSRYKRVACS